MSDNADPKDVGPEPRDGDEQNEAQVTASDTARPEGGPSDAAAMDVDVLSVLEARIRELEGQVADLTDRLLRTHAEMDNLRKRTEREKTDTAKYAISKFANDIVGMTDNFQRAVAAVPAANAETDPALKSLVDGVMMTERAFLQVLERHGVERIDPKDAPFDPNLHQAVMEQENVSVPSGTVLQVLQDGYTIAGRVLRPAMVIVSRGGPKPQKSAEPTEPDQPAPGVRAANDDGPSEGSDTPDQ